MGTSSKPNLPPVNTGPGFANGAVFSVNSPSISALPAAVKANLGVRLAAGRIDKKPSASHFFLSWLQAALENGQYEDQTWEELSELPESYLRNLFPEIVESGPYGNEALKMNNLLKRVTTKILPDEGEPDDQYAEAFRLFVLDSRSLFQWMPAEKINERMMNSPELWGKGVPSRKAATRNTVQGGFFSAHEFSQLRRVAPLSIELARDMIEVPMTALLLQDSVVGIGNSFTWPIYTAAITPWLKFVKNTSQLS